MSIIERVETVLLRAETWGSGRWETFWWWQTRDLRNGAEWAARVRAGLDQWLREPNNWQPWAYHYERKWQVLPGSVRIVRQSYGYQTDQYGHATALDVTEIGKPV